MAALNIATDDPAVLARTEVLLREQQTTIYRRVDRLFAALLIFEWIAGMVLALARAPRTWNGAESSVHPHIYSAAFLGAAIIVFPVWSAWFRPGQVLTRHVISAAQLLMSALLIHLGDGRIEMHFHVFGSLAFIAFYRDWRVLITATAIVSVDHLFRGLFLPQSVYGIGTATFVRTLEHAGWVIFEDIFLIASCCWGVREMRGIARQQALLEKSYQEVEQKVIERTQQLKDTQQDLLKAARSAGMADIATSVLHNVGNVLNSVNVSATVVADKMKHSEVSSLGLVSGLIKDHESDLGAFFTADERGRMLPGFISELAGTLADEQAAMLAEVANLSRGVDHIKQIVAAQQSMAKKSTVRTQVAPASLVETALSLQDFSPQHGIDVMRDLGSHPPIAMDEHRVLQILLNMISNARQAVMAVPRGRRQIAVSVRVTAGPEPEVVFTVTDTGSGIAADVLPRIFAHGFTTKKDGHGFGLHSAINAAKEMGGQMTATSDGAGKGACFTLQLPLVGEESACKA